MMLCSGVLLNPSIHTVPPSHTCPHTHHTHTTHTARTDRYSHDFASDEEDGPGDEDLQEEFKNFGTTTPRFSHLLDQLSFEDISNPPTPSSGPQSIASKIILEPNHEKRDSGISGIEDPAVKILDDDGDDAVTVLRHDSAESVHTVEDKDEEATDDDNDDGVITHIDEVGCL